MRHLSAANAFLALLPSMAASASPPAVIDSDAGIESLAQASYTFRSFLKWDDVKVNASGAVVTLTGTVADEYHKLLLQETVVGIPGVKRVNNLISSAGPLLADHSDPWITRRAEAILSLHKDLRARKIKVSTNSGLITLTGEADSEIQKRLVTEWARDIEGVEEVLNELTVARSEGKARAHSGQRVDDPSITAQVRVALLLHKSTHLLVPRVSTVDGVVTLGGVVETGVQHDRVTRLADSIYGVAFVKNRMTIQGPQRPTETAPLSPSPRQ